MAEVQEGKFQMSKREVPTAISVDMEMSIRKVDWKRIYRKVKSIPRYTSVYHILSAVAWGVSGSSFLSLIPLYQATAGTDPWVKPLYWLIGICTALIGWIIYWFSRERSSIIRSSCEEVLKDMSDIYKTFPLGDSLENGSN